MNIRKNQQRLKNPINKEDRNVNVGQTKPLCFDSLSLKGNSKAEQRPLIYDMRLRTQ